MTDSSKLSKSSPDNSVYMYSLVNYPFYPYTNYDVITETLPGSITYTEQLFMQLTWSNTTIHVLSPIRMLTYDVIK